MISQFRMDGEAHGGATARVKFGDVITLYSESLQGWLTSGDQVIGWGLWLPKLREARLRRWQCLQGECQTMR